MSIFQGSRYYNQLVDYVAFTPGGDQLPVVFYKFDDIGKISWQEHVYVQGERLDQIALKYYKTPEYWWLIPEYNPQISDFLNIPAGTILRIPNV